jgi:hypothetical protein
MGSDWPLDVTCILYAGVLAFIGDARALLATLEKRNG